VSRRYKGKHAPPRTAFGVMLRELRRPDPPMGCELYRTVGLRALAESRTIVVDPDQAMAATGAIDDLCSVRDLAQDVRAPFPATLLDFGPGIMRAGWDVGLLGALICDVGLNTTSLELLMLLGSPTDRSRIAIVYGSSDNFSSREKDVAGDLARYRETLAAARAAAEPDPEVVSSLEALVAGAARHLASAEELDAARTLIEEDPAMVQLLAAPYASLAVLESANVSLVESANPYARGHVAQGKPKFDIYIRQGRRSTRGDDGGGVEFSHRFEVRGNFAHHFELTAKGEPNRLFERWSVEKPEKVINIGGQPCVRIWRPPYVKGPEDKPLIPKIRHLPKASA
jgi:hypothetical protein